ncbi:MAG: hypothetical protein PHC64_03105 [Candidatus Gastranaerophilales bacterium]|nr:hypothetical protein [Candidatus Gastranaerophilales bacterium]
MKVNSIQNNNAYKQKTPSFQAKRINLITPLGKNDIFIPLIHTVEEDLARIGDPFTEITIYHPSDSFFAVKITDKMVPPSCSAISESICAVTDANCTAGHIIEAVQTLYSKFTIELAQIGVHLPSKN